MRHGEGEMRRGKIRGVVPPQFFHPFYFPPSSGSCFPDSFVLNATSEIGVVNACLFALWLGDAGVGLGRTRNATRVNRRRGEAEGRWVPAKSTTVLLRLLETDSSCGIELGRTGSINSPLSPATPQLPLPCSPAFASSVNPFWTRQARRGVSSGLTWLRRVWGT
ncbi:hypothetical protein BDY21DRAFT_145452 [Lineolata rhizophorae]|uniref:Uncharacterized protein n=1 Tax=Lineolata rhizophorae TaxID=578093 RepID=A0A6A6NMS6_9PEZI|nr:hypothetical protein BDY21DRAFT_145452 [Lineolata rhizophorae]